MTKKRAVLLAGVLPLASLAPLAGCSVDLVSDDAVESSDDSKGTRAVIINTVDWQEASALAEGTAERANSRAVAYLSIPAEGARCTGFLIAPDVVMTNHHCIPNADAARGVTANFNYEAGATTSMTYDCSVFVGNDAALDFALLQCPARPGDVVGVVGLDTRSAHVGDDVYVIHQNCDYYLEPNCAPTKKLSPGAVVTTSATEFGHNADTLGGSSGSPVFAKDSHKVIGLHHVGLGGNAAGRGTMNKAVSMSEIAAALATRFPSLDLAARAPSETPSTPPTADLYEPNDTAAGATVIGLPFASEGARIDANDVDVYRFDGDGGAHAITLSFQHKDGDLDLYVFDAAGNQVASSAGVSDTESVGDVLPTGPLYVQVLGYSGAVGAYSLTVR